MVNFDENLNMEDLLKEIQALRCEVAQLNKKMGENEVSNYFENWIPRKTVMKFLDYGDTQMAALFKTGELKVSQIGNRKFIYKPSVIKLIERNIKKE